MSFRQNLLTLLSGLAIVASTHALTIRIDSSGSGRLFDGFGTLDASGNAKLLMDYPEPYRSDILDYMYKPNFGAGFQALKVEMGAGGWSTCGSYPAFAVDTAEIKGCLPCATGSRS